MTYDYAMTMKDDYLLVTIGGESNTIEDVLSLADRVLIEAKRNNCTCILFDERTVTVNLDQHDVYQCTEALAEHLPSAGIRVAVVHNTTDLAIYQCFETMLRNRSINYKLFDDFQSAEKWLLPLC
ncbi:MAG: hypothetical protein OCC46_11025 [Pseudodesulfovibrio sp.]